MTGLYEALTLTLQKRFLEKIGRPEAWNWTPIQLNQDQQVNEIFGHLEVIAWTGMQERQLAFSFNTPTMEKILDQVLSWEENLRHIHISGFLQSTQDSEDILANEYSFLHLTFQEFFAARYLARLLQNNQVEAAPLLQKVKFDPRYKVVMWFTAGLLRNEGGDFHSLNVFFETLDSPKDLVGLYGTLLKIRCLEECGWQKKLQKIKFYEEKIGFWLEKIDLKKWRDPILKHLVG